MEIDLIRKIEALEARVAELESRDANSYVIVRTPDTANPPTDAQLDAELDTPANMGSGFTVLIDDNAGDANVYLVLSNGTSWWSATLTKLV